MQWSDFINVPDHEPVARLWRELASSIPGLATPTVYDTRETHDHDWFLSWHRDGQCFTVEMFSDGSLDWFWDVEPGSVYDGSDGHVAALPEQAITRLRHFRSEG